MYLDPQYCHDSHDLCSVFVQIYPDPAWHGAAAGEGAGGGGAAAAPPTRPLPDLFYHAAQRQALPLPLPGPQVWGGVLRHLPHLHTRPSLSGTHHTSTYWGGIWPMVSVADPKWFTPVPDPALNFSRSRSGFGSNPYYLGIFENYYLKCNKKEESTNYLPFSVPPKNFISAPKAPFPECCKLLSSY